MKGGSIMHPASCMTSHVYDEYTTFALHGSWAPSAQYTVGTVTYTQARSAANLLLSIVE